MKQISKRKLYKKPSAAIVASVIAVGFGIAAFFGNPQKVSAASFSLGPAGGTFTVGSTFDVSVYLDTEKENINTIRTLLAFPPDKLQLVPKGAGQSVISVYSSPPRFDNTAGIVDLQGGIPGGLNVSNGLVISLTFRVKAVGSALLRFRDETKVLANDGLGTNVLKNTQNGVYQLVLPPPAGPLVASVTHPDQAKWYSNTNAQLAWAGEEAGIEGYSYIINDIPADIPDDISEGDRTIVTYRNLSDGVHYFHLKALRRDNWGGVTHFALNIDANPPAEFPVKVIPEARTTRRQPILEFATTDGHSGLDHYELKVVPLSPLVQAANNSQPLFIEIISPYVMPELQIGNYDLILHAYDKSGNYREVTQRLSIVPVMFKIISGQGIEVRGLAVIPWIWFWPIATILLLLLVFTAWRLQRWHLEVEKKKTIKELPTTLREKLDELQEYRSRYGKLAALVLAVSIGLIALSGGTIQASELNPPFLTTVSKNITNEDIFYVGGKTDASGAEVVIYLQNLQTGETSSYSVTADQRGEWFYRHTTFLASGNYLLWLQSRLGDLQSPPSPQIQMSVMATAIQLGASRVSLELVYLILVILLALLVLGLGFYIF
ncbi:MAG: cohesin domain-containing protein, partial [Patescibacteria group bacterium]